MADLFDETGEACCFIFASRYRASSCWYYCWYQQQSMTKIVSNSNGYGIGVVGQGHQSLYYPWQDIERHAAAWRNAARRIRPGSTL
ncbi:hypothetical protein IVB30_39880 [Bradyrhizobium sp. 200]|uniref:hypothetical protein n=1 Tax=Bradyrhizobium sp. 200 TaxID=2782665 RepID=UPI001FFFAA5D|nr:hypothetical protein [Bradyrhizobium sp. 200]UPJ49070.1 hypothetical protein IVB30_39880 [Bradyrhizobium sp. 200]